MSTPEASAPDSMAQLEVVTGCSPLAAEIRNVDLSKLRETDFPAIYGAWLEHPVILIRDQKLSDQDLINFSSHFGGLDWAPVQETGRRFVDGHPEIYVVSNIIEDGIPIGSLGAGEAVWHTDMSYLENPPKASMLYALEIPETGGDTWFCDMYRAYELLSGSLKTRIAEYRIKHDATYNSGGYVRQGTEPIDNPIDSPGVYHPLVCTHPETGRKVLYLGRRRNAYIAGLDLQESEKLLDELWSYASREECTWRHQWRVGDVVIWDNRCTMHRRDAFDPEARRIMHRTQIKGDSLPAP